MQTGLRCVIPRRVFLRATDTACQRRIDHVHVSAQRQDVKQSIKQGIAHLLNQVGGTAVAHERRAGVAADDGPGE